MGSSRFWLKDADEESKSIPHEFPRSHWLKATGQCVIERYLSATMRLLLEVLSSFEYGDREPIIVNISHESKSVGNSETAIWQWMCLIG